MAAACASPASPAASIATSNPSVIPRTRPFRRVDFPFCRSSIARQQSTPTMNFDFSDKTKDLQRRLQAFMDENIYPNEPRLETEIERNRWTPAQNIEHLTPHRPASCLGKLFLPINEDGAGLTNLECAP